ncbi:MAG: SCP2 sterol-binding domain-containing protein [Thermodesulfobacteriota bacterium]
MNLKPNAILFITSFVPVFVFKVLSRVGDASLSQAKVAIAAGLILAGIQFLLSKKFLKHSTYLERMFLAYLGVGAAWVYLAPARGAYLFVDHSTTLLYFVLFLTTLIPQTLGYDPFTYTIAKRMVPEQVWKTPQFRTINLHLTYFWSGIFLINLLLSGLGHGKPLFSVLIPLVLILGIGIPVVKIYPKYYLKKIFTSQFVDPSYLPNTARELILAMPRVFCAEAANNLKAEIQFKLSGEGGGEITLSISGGECIAREGEALSPVLTIISTADLWLKIARREIDPARALMDGLYEVKGDMNLLVKMRDLFRPPTEEKKKSSSQGEKER